MHLRSDLLGGEDDDDGDGEGVYMNSENGILSPGEVEGGNLRCEGREGGEICNCDIRFARLTCDSASLSLAAVRVLEMLSLVGTGEGERSSCSNGQWSSASPSPLYAVVILAITAEQCVSHMPRFSYRSRNRYFSRNFTHRTDSYQHSCKY